MQSRRKILLSTITIIILGLAYFSPITGGDNKVEAAGRMADIESVMEQIEIGRQAMAMAERYEVEIQLETGQGTAYRSYSNTMVIEASYRPERAALSFIHEVLHTQYHHERMRPDMASTGREIYISARLSEEAEAMALSIEAKMEMIEAGLDVDGVGYPLETFYHEARTTAEKTAIADERGFPAPELKAIGQGAGLARMMDAFANGEVKTSHTHEPYPDYYGQCWDRSSKVFRVLNLLKELASGQMIEELMSGLEQRAANYC